MKNITLRKNINVDKPNLIPIFNLKEDDDAIIKLALFKNSIEFDVTTQTLRLGAKTSKGIIEQIGGLIVDKNNIDIELKNSILTPGLIEFDLELKDAEGTMTTASFYITVSKKVLNDEAVEATNEFDTFTKTVDKIESDYTGLRKIIIDENQAASLQDQINNVNSSLDNVNNKINYIVRPEMFEGADDSDRIQKAIDYLVNNKKHGIVTLNGEYTLDRKITVDISYCSIEGNAFITSNVVDGATIHITGGLINVNNMIYQNKAHIGGFILRGNRQTGSIGLLFQGNNTSGLTIDNIEIEEFYIGERFESNAYLISHIGCSVGRCNIGVQMPDGFTNYGENISYNSCSISNNEICIQNINPNGNFHFNNCSLDYSVMLVDAQRGGVFLNNCHMETNNNSKVITKAIFKTGAYQDAYIKIDGGLIMYWNKPNFKITSCFETSYNKDTICIHVDGTKFYNVYQFSEALCSGTGKIKLQNVKEPTEGYVALTGVISNNNNLLNSDFYNNFLEVDITKYAGNKTDNVTCENISVSKHENGLKIVKTTSGSDGAVNIFVPIHNNICTYSLKVTDIKNSNDGVVYLTSSYGKLIFDENGYIKKSYLSNVGATRNITPLNSSSVVYTNQATGERSPSWATHYVLTFNANAYKGAFKIHDLIINSI